VLQREQRIGATKVWSALTIGGTVAFVLTSLVYFLLGRANADEGWYLYASRLVYRGKIPYQDFAYTQTPLLPYVYGISQVLLRPGLYTGRATSLLFLIATAGFNILLAKRYSGIKAAGLTALLLAAFPYGVYFGVIVKTYALVMFLFTLTLFILSSQLPNDTKYPLAATVALLAALVRLSAAPYFFVIMVYGLTKVKRHVRYLILASYGVVAITSLLFILPNAHSVQWNLLGHHLGQWGEASAADKIQIVLCTRIPVLIAAFLSYVLLGLSMAVIAMCNPGTRRRASSYLRQHPDLALVMLGLGLFAGAHLWTGGFHTEYFVPAMIPLSSIVSIAYLGILRSLGSPDPNNITHKSFTAWGKALLHVVFAFCLVLPPFRQTPGLVDLSGGSAPIEEIEQVAQIIINNTTPSDRIMALEALWIAVEANRDILPGLTMAQFSYQNVDRHEAQELKVVNDQLVLEYLERASAKAVIFTDLDVHMLRQSQMADVIWQALQAHYELVASRTAFGQRSGEVYVYLRRD